jgi:hypothetical protein
MTFKKISIHKGLHHVAAGINILLMGGGVSQDSEKLSIILALISYLCVFLMLLFSL